MRLRSGIALTAWVLAGSTLAAQQPDTSAASPFSGFETRILANGLKVWFKQATDFPDVVVTMSVPVGSRDDPRGFDQLAHFTEHLAFSEHAGLTEQQINTALSDRGGSNNATTSPDQTYYYARIGKTNGLFALHWLYGIISPKALKPAVVAKQRDPVLIEVKAEPRDLADWIYSLYVYPPVMRAPSFFKREFGVETRLDRDVDNWAGVHRIDSAIVRRFYDRYYVPAVMTLTIIGDLPAGEVWAMVDSTYGRLPAGRAPPLRRPLVDPGRGRTEYAWLPSPSNTYTTRYKTYRRSARQDLVLQFVNRYLAERLNDQLRFGEHKAAYGVGVSQSLSDKAGLFQVRSVVKKGELDYVRATIDSEIARLRSGAVPDSEFASVKNIVTEGLRTATTTSWAIASLANYMRLDDRAEFREFPDILGVMRALTKPDVEMVMRDVFVPERRVTETISVLPFPTALLVVLVIAVVFGAIRLAQTLLVTPLPMATLRYVTRLRSPILQRLATLGGFTLLVLILARIVAWAIMLIAVNWVQLVDSFAVQLAFACLVMGATVLYFIGAASLMPSKLLVFEDGLAIKSKSFRSKWIPFTEIVEIEHGDAKRPLRLRLRNGRSYSVRTRDTTELAAVISRVRGATGSDHTSAAGILSRSAVNP